MLIETVIFYVFAVLFVASAVMVVTQQNTVHAALFLVLTFFFASSLWIMLEAEFLALVLVLVYVGAVMTLFLFVIMMLQLDKSSSLKIALRYLPWGILIVIATVAALIYAIKMHHFSSASLTMPPHESASFSNIRELGLVLYTRFVYPFEIAAVLLLVAIVAAISLSLRKPRSKKQNVAAQIRVKREECVRLVQMPSQKKERNNQ